jgi:hypothetical protein
MKIAKLGYSDIRVAMPQISTPKEQLPTLPQPACPNNGGDFTGLSGRVLLRDPLPTFNEEYCHLLRCVAPKREENKRNSKNCGR